MDERDIPDRARQLRGAEPCGCLWERGYGMVVFAARCGEHKAMCRNLEQWELDLFV